MLRRSIISMAGVMPLTMAFPSRAQVPTRVHRIGFLSPNARESPTSKATLEEFLAFLQTLGYAEGRNLIADVRYAEGQTDRLAALAAELAALKPDVIVALTTQGTLAARRAAPSARSILRA